MKRFTYLGNSLQTTLGKGRPLQKKTWKHLRSTYFFVIKFLFCHDREQQLTNKTKQNKNFLI